MIRSKPANRGQEQTHPEGEGHPQQSAQSAQERSLEEKLQNQVSFSGADGLADSNLFGSLRHGYQHDIHNYNAADHQGQQGHGHDHRGHNRL